MTVMYHVAPAWTDGDDLLSLDEQINRGLLSEKEAKLRWKWEHPFESATDRQYVSLWRTLGEAKAWQSEVGGGVVLSVDVDTDSAAFIDDVGEGHPGVLGWIPGEFVRLTGRVSHNKNVGRIMREKVIASSFERYNGGVKTKRRWGSSTITRFYVRWESDAHNASAWEIIEGYGPTPGDRKTYAIQRFLEKRGFTPNGTSLTFGVMPSLSDFRRHLRSFSFDGEQYSITDSGISPVYKMELVGKAAEVAHHAADAVPGVRMRHGRKMSVSFDDVAALHEFLVSLTHHYEDGKKHAGELASAMLETLGYEWV
jgi:hypothetical protein